jgi:hypothetical protein
MGVEKPTLSVTEKKTLLDSKNYKELCISFGNGQSKKEGEQKAAKMALILHGRLNNDQYNMTDIFYPSFDKISITVKNEEDEYNINSEFTDED